MPKTRGKLDKQGLVLCRCKPRCLKLNAATGRYEGSGEYVSPKIKAVHRRDERLLALLQNGREGEPREDNPDPLLVPLDDFDEEELNDAEYTNQEKWRDLISAHLDVFDELPGPVGENSLVFVNDPKVHGPYIYDYSPVDADEDPGRQVPAPNTGPHSLDCGAVSNQPYLERENSLWELSRMLESFHPTAENLALRERARQYLCALEMEKAHQWETIRGQLRNGPYFNTGEDSLGFIPWLIDLISLTKELYFNRRSRKSRVIDAASILSLVLQFHYFLPRRGCEVSMSGIADVLSLVQPDSRSRPSSAINVPVDPRPFPSRFNLDPITSTYISCVDCHCLYPYRRRSTSEKGGPQSCTFRRAPASNPCAANLWKKIDRGPLGVFEVPIRKYVHQGLKAWLGRLFSRPGMEKVIHDYPRSLLSIGRNGDSVDIWQGEIFRKIKDTHSENGRLPFFPGPVGELRLAFSLSVDGFHPFINKAAGQSATSTGIWLVLLNLPPHLRYLPQNVYLAGVIPGPNKPSNDEINHYVQLVVNDFQELYNPGVHFSRTHDFRNGRLCRGMVIPVVCDLLGAHQVVGYPGAPTAHYFCTCCELDIHDINVIDTGDWPKKDIYHIRRFAQLYRDARTEKDKQAIFEGCGWRWSPLFELEYWDPSVFTVIDSMHALDLNLKKHHVQNLFQIDVSHRRGEALRPPTMDRVKRVVSVDSEVKALKKCQDMIYENPPNLLYQLLKVQRKVLYSFCLDYDIRSPDQNIVTGTRWILARAIHLWRQNQTSNSVSAFLRRYPLVSPTQQQLIEGNVAENGDAEYEALEEEEEEEEEEEIEVGSQAPSARRSVERDVDEPSGETTAPPTLKASVVKRHSMKLLDLVDAESDERKEKPVYDRITVAILAHICDLLSLDRSRIAEGGSSKTEKRKLFDFVLQELEASPEKREFLRDQVSRDHVVLPASAPFLGEEVMQAVWLDMSRTRLPSWITPAPRDWGTSRRGKLSADNWRVICCIHLPITLLRLFGTSDGRTRLLVDNFMQLVSAARVATASVTSARHIEEYNQKIFAYTRGVLELYPDYSILPSHHAALHIGDMLRYFGPKHSHDSPYYERYIHLFHRMNTNHKIGEVEGTFLRTAMRSANLLSLLQDSADDQELVEEMLRRLEMHDKERLRGFRLAESLDPLKGLCEDGALGTGLNDHRNASDVGHLRDIPLLEYTLLCRDLQEDGCMDDGISRQAIFLSAVSHQQNVYAIWDSRRYKDSCILFQGHQREHAGVIQTIFMHSHELATGEKVTRTYTSVKVYEGVDGEDRFRTYGYAGGFCCKPNPTRVQLVPLESVLSHIAVTDFSEEGVTHILPISRRMLSLESCPDAGA